MADKLWKDCSKEEKRTVNTIVRCYRYLYGGYKSKKYNSIQWEIWKGLCIFALNLCEWYYSDTETDRRDYRNWKEGYEMYNKVREKL